MKHSLASLLLAAALLGGSPAAHGDDLRSGWTLGVACPAAGSVGTEYAFTANNSNGFAMSGGKCQRTTTNFTKLRYTSVTGGTPRATNFYALQTGDWMIVPPIQTTEQQPIFAVQTGCPATDKTVNWLYVQWNDGAVALSHTYLLGTADITTNGSVSVRTQYDIDGGIYFGGSVSLGTGGCAGGVTPVSGANNSGGEIFWTPNDGGVFKTTPGRATFFLPAQSISASAFATRVFQGITFDSSSSNFGIFADGAGDVRNVKATANSTGTVVTVQPYSNPETGSIDTGTAGYTDTLTLTAFNKPKPGMILGNVKRTGQGARCQTPPCTGRIACIARTAGASGHRLICSGESPLDNSIPYNITLFRPYTCPAGFVLAPKDNQVGVYDDFCVAKYEMKNVGGTAVSEKEGTPWVGLTRDDALAQCRALGDSYDLMSNAEWQTLARNIEDTYELNKYVNWSNGSKSGDNFINRGHSDASPAFALAAGADNDPCFGTEDPNCALPADSSFSQKRTHKLNNGKVLWDLAGNVSEWLKDDNLTRHGKDGYVALETWSAGEKNKWGAKGNYASGATPKLAFPFGGFGFAFLDYNAGAILRGGSFSQSSSGVFHVNLAVSPATTDGALGFRCAYHTAPVQDPASLGFSPGSWEAGIVLVGQSASGTVTLTNSGKGPARFADPPFTLTTTGMTIVDNQCPTSGGTLGPGASCVLSLRFSPLAPGPVSDFLTANWTSPGLSGVQSTLAGVRADGIAPGVAVVPDRWDAGKITYNTSTESPVFTVMNGTSNPITMASPPLVPGAATLTVSETTCPSAGGTLVAGGRCTFRLRLTPALAGAASSSLNVNWTAPGVSGTQSTVLSNLTWTGIRPGNLTLTSTVYFGAAPNSKWFTAINNGDTALTFATPSSAAVGPGLSFGRNDCRAGARLAPQGLCLIEVIKDSAPDGKLAVFYTTPGVSGVRSAEYLIMGGTGPALASVDITPMTHYAGGINVGASATATQIYTMRNRGTAAATMANPAFTVSAPGFSIVNISCPASGGTLAAGVSCTFRIQFAPVAEGPVTGTIRANWTAAGYTGTQASYITHVQGIGLSALRSIYRGVFSLPILLGHHLFTADPAELVFPYSRELGTAAAFKVYRGGTASCAGGAGTALYRCSADIARFVSNRSDCGDSSGLLAFLGLHASQDEMYGYVCTAATAGTKRLYRIRKTPFIGVTDVLVTQDATEYANLKAAGWVDMPFLDPNGQGLTLYSP